MMSKMIGIGGISRAGKTSLALHLAGIFEKTVLLALDDYVLPKNQLPRIIQAEDWEHPLSVDWNRLFSVIEDCENDCDLILIEGILAFAHPDLNHRYSGGIYLRLPRKSYWEMRHQETRWGNEPDWYLDYVWEAHQVYGKPNPLLSNWLELPDFHTSSPFEPAMEFIRRV